MESSLSCVLLLLCGLWSLVCPGPLTINKTVGDNVTLVPQNSRDASEINWKMNGNKLVDMELKPQLDIIFYHLQDRANISHTDGVLTIRNLTTGDSGNYKAEVVVNSDIRETEINLIVLDKNVKPAFTSSTGPPNSSVTSTTKGPSFSSSHGPPETKKTKSHTEGPSASSTTHSTRLKKTGMLASTRTVIIVVASLVVMGVFVGCLLWCFCGGKKGKQIYKTKDQDSVGLLIAVKSEETEAGNDVKSGVKRSSLDAPGTETEVRNNVQPEVKSESSSLDAPGTGEKKAGNDVKSEVKRSSVEAPGTETEVGNDVQPEEKRSSLDAPGTEETEAGNDVKSEEESSSLESPETEAKPGNNVQPEEKRSSLDAPGTETEAGNDVKPEEKRSSLDTPGTETKVGNDVQPEEKRSSLDAPGTEETEVGVNVQSEEDEPVTVL